MVDWMVEVCTSFKCSERTWFLAVILFDEYLYLTGEMIKNKSIIKKPCLKNSDVHALGIAAIYLASKYEDVIPIHSLVAHEKISHKSVSQ